MPPKSPVTKPVKPTKEKKRKASASSEEEDADNREEKQNSPKRPKTEGKKFMSRAADAVVQEIDNLSDQASQVFGQVRMSIEGREKTKMRFAERTMEFHRGEGIINMNDDQDSTEVRESKAHAYSQYRKQLEEAYECLVEAGIAVDPSAKRTNQAKERKGKSEE
jgi:hypothetical protein